MMGLTFYPDSQPGIQRLRRGRGFRHIAPDGTRIEHGAGRQRLEAMAVPPAYDDVWMTPIAEGHLWATGRDQRKRKQYRYHPDWRVARDAPKFEGLAAFGVALPAIRRWIAGALDGPPGEFDTAMAVVLGLIDRASLRIGTETYVRENKTYGATTLRTRDVTVSSNHVMLDYRGKGGARVRKKLHGPRLHRAIHRSADLPAAELATWIDKDGNPQPIRSEQVNARISYLSDGAGTAKMFRMWNGTLAGFRVAVVGDRPTIGRVSEAAADVLHNTPTIARKSYIHPDIIDLVSVGDEMRRAIRNAETWEGAGFAHAGEGAPIEYIG